MLEVDPDQLPMFPAVSSEPTGWWADAGRFMVGEAEEMPAVPPPVLVAVRELGSAALHRGGVAPSMALGAGPSPGQTGASHAREPQEANGGAFAPETAHGSARGPSLATGPATAAEWVDRVEACGCTRRVQMAGPRGTWALGYRVERCEGHSGGRR